MYQNSPEEQELHRFAMQRLFRCKENESCNVMVHVSVLSVPRSRAKRERVDRREREPRKWRKITHPTDGRGQRRRIVASGRRRWRLRSYKSNDDVARGHVEYFIW